MKAALGYAGLIILLALAGCGGGGSSLPGPDNSAALSDGVIEGYITEADVLRGTSAVGDGIPGVEVWCENPGTGQRLGQDTTGDNGHYRIGGLPDGEPLLLKFQYRLAKQNGDVNQRDVEGAQQVRLEARQQLRVDAGICLYDDDGDGTPEEVRCDNEQLQVRLQTREQEQSGGGEASGTMNQNGSMGDDGTMLQQQTREQLRDGECSCGGDCEGQCNCGGDCGDDPEQTRDQQRDQLRDGEGEGSCGEDCDPEQARDRDRDGKQSE